MVMRDGSMGELDYRMQLQSIMREPTDPREGIGIEEMRRSIRVLDALEAYNDGCELEDADFEHLVQKVKNTRFIFVSKELIQFVDDVTGA